MLATAATAAASNTKCSRMNASARCDIGRCDAAAPMGINRGGLMDDGRALRMDRLAIGIETLTGIDARLTLIDAPLQHLGDAGSSTARLLGSRACSHDIVGRGQAHDV